MFRHLSLVLAAMVVSSTCAAASLTWTGAVSQETQTAGNWSPAQVPAATDDLIWNFAGGPFVRFGLPAVQTSRSWTMNSGASKDLFTQRTHTVTQSVRVAGGFCTLSSVDSIVVNGDIEVESFGSATVQQGCKLVGLDSARVSSGTLHANGFTTLVRARHVLVGGSLLTSAQGSVTATQSLAVVGNGLIGAGGNGQITGPSLMVPGGARVLASGSGRLVLNGDLTLAGELTCETSGRVQAATVRATSGSIVVGSGVIDALFVAEDANVRAQAGKLTAGKAGVPSAVVLSGTLEVTPQSEFECLSATAVTLPSFATMDRGTLRSASGFAMGAGGYLSASGRVEGNLSMTDADQATTFAFPHPGRLTVAGDWSMTGGTLTVNLAQTGSVWEAESLVVTGVAQPGGALNVFTPDPEGTSGTIPFLWYSSRPSNRVFESITLNGGEVTDEFEVQYLADRAVLVFGGTVAVDEGPLAPGELEFVGRSGRSAALELSLPGASDASVCVFDVLGRERARLHRGALAAGVHRFPLAAAGALESGVYFGRASVRTSTGESLSRSARVVVLKR